MSLTELSGAPTPEPATTAEKPAPPARRTSPFGALLLRLHFYAGILVAPFLVVAALTGLAYTTTPQLDTILYGDQLTVAEVGDRQLPLAEQIGAARNAHPDGSITTVQPGDGDRSTTVVFSFPNSARTSTPSTSTRTPLGSRAN